MDDKKKIVLGSEDIITKGLQDVFININLQKTFNQIKEDKYDNNFDLAEQFRKERNLSRSFRVYGIVDSNILDTNSFDMDIYKDSGLTRYHSTISTTPLIYDEKNIFNKKRGKYLLELDNYDSDFVYMKITGDRLTYADQVFEQQLVFYTLDGEFVEYGTQTVDIGFDNGGFLEIENDFPFFYNKHWIKKDIEVVETKKAIVSFKTLSTTVDEGESTTIKIELDKPSPFGNEKVQLNANIITAHEEDFQWSVFNTQTNVFDLVPPFGFSYLDSNNQTVNVNGHEYDLSWAEGEQEKTISFSGVNDFLPEFTESLTFDITNLVLVDGGEILTHHVNINDTTPRNYANYHFGEMYRNRNNFTGRTYNHLQWQNGSFVPVPRFANSFGVLRNGLYYERRNEEFYPNDTYELSIENKGNDTIIPANPVLGISQEEIFKAGDLRTFDLKTQYDGTQVQKIKVIMSGSSASSSGANKGYFVINGNVFTLTSSRLDYNNIKSTLGSTYYNPLLKDGVEEPWSYDFDDSARIITITSKSPGVPVDFSVIETNGPTNIGTVPVDPSKSPIVEVVDNFVFYDQIPLSIKLAANALSNIRCNYEFIISKQGFNGVVIPGTLINTNAGAGTDNYLVSKLGFTMRAWDDSINDCFYRPDSTADPSDANLQTWSTLNVIPNPVNFIMPVGGAYINGSVLGNSSVLNLTGTLTAEFYPKKLAIKPCTDALTNPNGVKQISKLTIPGIGQGNEASRQLHLANANGFRSFDFRTGSTGSYTTFSHTNTSFFTSGDWKWATTVQVAGGSFGGTNGPMSQILDYGNGSSIPVGPLEGQLSDGTPLTNSSNTNIMYLESKEVGVPFSITNIVNASVHTTASDVYGNSLTAGTILGQIEYEVIVQNAIPGGPNVARNYMGGFNPILQFFIPQPPVTGSTQGGGGGGGSSTN